ncbi:hypothetical protein PUN28_008171 [Cardiocondyla obscurior]|uniref:Uncharacterized protein n=1 Tax=Cardiocondyla obscurior TaxID=286306 RepID=A0AAW2FYK9_9HYME
MSVLMLCFYCINAVFPLVNIFRKIFYAYFIRLWEIYCFLECPDGFSNKFESSFWFPQSAKTVHQRESIFIKVLKVIGKRYVTAANQRDHPETRGSRRSPSDHSWCKRKIFDSPSTPDSTNTFQSEFRQKRKIFDSLSTPNSTNTFQSEFRFLVIGVLRESQKFHCTCTACENSSAYSWSFTSTGTIFYKSFKSDRFLVIGVLRGSQKFHCTCTACENSSAYSWNFKKVTVFCDRSAGVHTSS